MKFFLIGLLAAAIGGVTLGGIYAAAYFVERSLIAQQEREWRAANAAAVSQMASDR